MLFSLRVYPGPEGLAPGPVAAPVLPCWLTARPRASPAWQAEPLHLAESGRTPEPGFCSPQSVTPRNPPPPPPAPGHLRDLALGGGHLTERRGGWVTGFLPQRLTGPRPHRCSPRVCFDSLFQKQFISTNCSDNTIPSGKQL